MALSKEQIAEIMQLLKDTSMRPEGGVQYPAEVMAFENRAKVEMVTMEARSIPFTVYQCVPKMLHSSAPLFINIHGGGWYIPHEVNDLCFSCWLADQIQGVVLSVDYTTSDQEPWDVMFEQCYQVIRYAFRQADGLGCSRDRISIGGYSAGGHLTAGLALKAAEEGYKLKHQIICYAPLDMRCKKEGEADAGTKRMQLRMKCFLDLLFRRNAEYANNPYANPIIASEEMIRKLPPALVITAGMCGFRFENEAYGMRMAQQGVEVTLKRFTEARHGFIPHFGEYWEQAAQLMVEKVSEL